MEGFQVAFVMRNGLVAYGLNHALIKRLAENLRRLSIWPCLPTEQAWFYLNPGATKRLPEKFQVALVIGNGLAAYRLNHVLIKRLAENLMRLSIWPCLPTRADMVSPELRHNKKAT